jgi:hypothetical protein
MKGDKPTMNDFGSNSMVTHVRVLYLNVGMKWKKNQVLRLNLTRWPTPKYGQFTIPIHHHDRLGI